MRFDWGPMGAAAVCRDVDVAVVVDVLSFTTTVTVAADLGVEVLPFGWPDETAERYAEEHDAVLAAGRSSAGLGQLSLSAASFRTCARLPERVVLPSPNGSALARSLAGLGIDVVAAALRNAPAVAAWIRSIWAAPRVAVLAAGERWPDGSLRPAVEDLWGAGAVVAALAAGAGVTLSLEAEAAQAAYERVRRGEHRALGRCAGGRELLDRGFAADVDIAAEVESSRAVPILRDGRFVPAGPTR